MKDQDKTREQLINELGESRRIANSYNRTLIEASVDPLVTISADGKITDVNSATERVTGCSRDELIGTDFSDYFTEPERAGAGYQQVFKEGLVKDYELEIRHRNGHVTPVTYSASVYRDESGEVTGVFAAARDITYRKKAEEILRQASLYNRTLIEISPDPLVTISAEGKITDVNLATEELTGCSRDELIGTDFSDYFSDPEKARAGYQQVFRDGCVKDYELDLRHENGQARSVLYNASVYRDESGEVTGVFAAARDITYRKKAEEILRRTSAYNRNLIEASVDPLVTISADGKITDVNSATEELTGRSRDELIGTDFSDYFTEPERARAGYQQVFKEGLVKDYELEIRHRNGHVTPVTYSASVYRDGSGEVVGVFAAARDISRRKQAEELLKRAHDQLEQRVRERTAELQSTNEELLREIEERKNAQRALASEKQRFQTLVEDAPFGLVMVGEDGSFQYINPKFRELFGYDLSEIPNGKEWFRQVYPDPVYRHEVISDWVEDVTGSKLNEQRSKVFTVRCKDGTDKIVHFRPVECEMGERLITCEDITDRKRAEDTIQAQIEFLNTVLESLTHPFHVIDANNYTVVLANSASNLDLSSGESTCYALTHHRNEPCNRSEHPCPLEEVKKTRRSVVLEHMHYDKDGNVRNVEIHAHPILDAQGNITQVIEYNFDITERKLAEEDLRQTTERLELVLDGAELGLWDLEVPSGQAVVNQRAADFFGYRLDEIEPTFDFWASLIHPDDGLLLMETFNSLCDGRTAFVDVERRVRHKSGEWKWIQVRGKVVVRDKDGRPLRMTGTFMDITRRKREEEELRETTARLKAVVNASPEIIYFKDLNGRNLIVNKGLAELIGMEEKDIVGRTDQELLPPDLADQCLRSDNEVLKRREPVYAEESVMDDKGRKVFFASIKFPVLDDQGNLIGLGGVSRDITERKHAEDALRESERRNRLLIEESPVGIGIWRDLRLIYANPAFLETFGYENQDEVLDRPVENFVVPEDRELIRKRGEDRLAGKPVPLSYEVKGLKKNGDSFDLALWPRRIDYLGGPAILGFVADRTEERNLRAQLLQAQKMEAIGTLAGGIAHDFNNLLTVILGFSELLLIDKDEQNPAYADLQKINQAAWNGADLVKRILTFSRKADICLRPLNLNHQIERVKNLLTRTIPKMIEIKVIFSDDLATVNADPMQVEQVLMNLAVNAKDAMIDKGTLTIETKNVTMDEDYCRMHPGAEPGDYVLLSVSDTGHGMDNEIRTHIFEPFYTTKEAGKGTGLGLAMVYGIVKQHGGYITCYSESGHGTTFKVYLPALVAERDQLETATREATSRGGTETILLVDDEEFVRDLGKRILERSGYTVLTAANGKEALDLYKKERDKISLVILDFVMPEMGGMECFQKLLEISPQVKVLISSGYTSRGTVKDASELGARGLVVKPYDVREMLQTVRDVLDKK